MSDVISLFPMRDERKKYHFVNMPVKIQGMDGDKLFPCIGLYRKDAVDVPVWYPLYERWYISADKVEIIAPVTLRKKASAICAFLNHVLWKTDHEYIHEITLNSIRAFLLAYQKKEDGKMRSAKGWEEGVTFVYDFLACYHNHNKDTFVFAYSGADLVEKCVVSYEAKDRIRTKVIKDYKYFSVKPIKQLTKKNRMLLFGYVDFFLLECEMYDPELTLGVALQSYAGIREGEVVNLTYGRIILREAGFGRIGDITLDLLRPAPFIKKERQKTFGSIKGPRPQQVYPDFTEKVLKYYQAHAARHNVMGYPTKGTEPLFRNKRGDPMSVSTYTERVKKVFYEHFLPDLKKASELMGSWAKDAPYIEAYEEDYPGAHAFRHWFTMYLFQRARLKPDEISKWRGDRSRQSMLDYLHINAEMLESFEKVSHIFNRSWLEEIL